MSPRRTFAPGRAARSSRLWPSMSSVDELLSQGSSKFDATDNQLHRHDGEDEPWDRRAHRGRREKPKTQHDYAERMPLQCRCQPAKSDVLCGCLMYDFCSTRELGARLFVSVGISCIRVSVSF